MEIPRKFLGQLGKKQAEEALGESDLRSQHLQLPEAKESVGATPPAGKREEQSLLADRMVGGNFS